MKCTPFLGFLLSSPFHAHSLVPQLRWFVRLIVLFFFSSFMVRYRVAICLILCYFCRHCHCCSISCDVAVAAVQAVQAVKHGADEPCCFAYHQLAAKVHSHPSLSYVSPLPFSLSLSLPPPLPPSLLSSVAARWLLVEAYFLPTRTSLSR